MADYRDGHAEWWHAVRTTDGREIRLDFDTAPGVATGTQVRVHGDPIGERMHVRGLDVMPKQTIGAAAGEPPTYAAPATDTYALVLVDLGNGVNITTASGQTTLFASGPTDKSFANYYKEVSYGKYQVSGDVIGPFPFSMTTCDTTGMYKAIEPMITGTYNHLIYYFNQSSLCSFGGLGEEGSTVKPAKRTWMNGSLSCVVLMQEPGHNLGLMHANTMKCGTSSFSTTPATSCTITEYGSGMSTMGGGCKGFNAYERWYMQWLTGCNGVRVPASGTFNLLPLESNCSGGSGIQVLQVPFPATLTVSDPQSTSTAVNLNNYYVELRTAGGIFDTYSTSTRGTVFSGPTVFIYTSDNVRVPTTTTRGSSQNSVWTELLNMSPSGTAYTGLTTAGQSFVDPAGGPTITLTSISATGATIDVSYPTGSGSPTCIDGSALTAPGPTSCSGSSTGTGGTSGTGGTTATGGTTGAGGSAGRSGTGGTTTTTTGAGGSAGRPGSGGTTTTTTGAGGSAGRPGTTGTGGTAGRTGTGGSSSTGGNTAITGSGGSNSGSGSGGNNSSGGNNGSGGTTSTSSGTGASSATSGNTLTGGCSCSTGTGSPAGSALWLSLGLGLVLARTRRRARR